MFDSAVELSRDGEPSAMVPPDAEPFSGVDFLRGPAELAQAIVEGRPHRGAGAHAAHVVEVLEAIATAAREDRAVDVTSDV